MENIKQMKKNNGVRAFALEGDYGGCGQVNRYIHGGEGTAQEAAAAIGFSIYRTGEMAELISYMRQYNESEKRTIQVFYSHDPLAKAAKLPVCQGVEQSGKSEFYALLTFGYKVPILQI